MRIGRSRCCADLNFLACYLLDAWSGVVNRRKRGGEGQGRTEKKYRATSTHETHPPPAARGFYWPPFFLAVAGSRESVGKVSKLYGSEGEQLRGLARVSGWLNFRGLHFRKKGHVSSEYIVLRRLSVKHCKKNPTLQVLYILSSPEVRNIVVFIRSDHIYNCSSKLIDMPISTLFMVRFGEPAPRQKER
ncbi:uncharacterized protein BO72DRAFT_255738 [Aspergillus fijiensis CBS 313.89]|uniref:Uncharacterized protein n=1 Tax=Aspergillus fijiensis CBS 313.89 TaxID=1448319 RepID=A0A8G1VV55_9EURO|nr:uncharacterized protein BO72DRAFT_255738 [Aspergillus fijiensis CBS 313.89]RAK72873.1 hypothetical protein BO72DRAFT_255738 [Aspergillus fijiensis CBS 313.89]